MTAQQDYHPDQLNGSSVRYQMRDLTKWINDHKRGNTSQSFG